MNTSLKLLVALVTLSFCVSSWAAKPRNPFAMKQSVFGSSTSMKDDVLMALQLPLDNRIKSLRRLGSKSLNALAEIAFDSKQPLQPRWRSITSMGRIFPKRSQAVIERAVKSKEWYLRNAGLVAMAHGDHKWATEWSMKLLSDKAMIVRTAAVQTLKKLNARESETLLWRKLYSQENYRNGKSLWVRKHIADALSSFAAFGQEKKFIQMLTDTDKRLHKPAIKALEKITKNAIGLRRGPLKLKRDKWLAWWQQSPNKG